MTTTTDIPGVILAGGAGRRMGGDKPFVLLAGRPLIAHVQARIAAQCACVGLNYNGDPARLTTLAAGADILPDAPPLDRGPLAGVLTALRWAARIGAARVLTVPVDTPFVPLDLATRLVHAHAPIAFAATPDGVHGTCGLWDVTLAEALADALDAGTRKLTDFTDTQSAREVTFPDAPPHAFFNINRPDDIAQAELLLTVS